jgi:hypothetical protein
MALLLLLLLALPAVLWSTCVLLLCTQKRTAVMLLASIGER